MTNFLLGVFMAMCVTIGVSLILYSVTMLAGIEITYAPILIASAIISLGVSMIEEEE
jgi:hypothetical protein